MERRDERDRLAPVFLSLLAVLFLGPAPASAQERLDPSAPRSFAAYRLSLAVQDAESRLESSACREVFGDFRDPSGRTMQDLLDEIGRTLSEHLGLLVFLEGEGNERCGVPQIMALTQPGSRAIFICSRQFLKAQRKDPRIGAAVIIHEELHSLGLRENPPSSEEITARVIARCGR